MDKVGGCENMEDFLADIEEYCDKLGEIMTRYYVEYDLRPLEMKNAIVRNIDRRKIAVDLDHD